MLAGKVAYVSGGAGTLGAAIARRLADDGAAVVLGDVDVDGAEAIAAQLREGGADARAVAHDVTSADSTDAALAATLAAHGRVDIACANAGIPAFAPVLAMPDDLWQRALDINITGVLLTLRSFGRAMVEAGGGSLVVTASISSLRGAPLLGAYCASKFAVMGLAECMATEVAAHGVRVNCVCPGPVEGPLSSTMIRANAEDEGLSEEEALAALVAPIAFKRLVRPEEVADAVAFLASDRSAGITGQRLVVDGGMLAK